MSTCRDSTRALISTTRALVDVIGKLLDALEESQRVIGSIEEHRLEGHRAPFGNSDCPLCVRPVPYSRQHGLDEVDTLSQV